MKTLFTCILLFIFFLGNAIAESKDRNVELNQLFDQLKKSKDVSAAIEIENKIWKIWSIHPSNDRRGYRLTELLAQGSFLMANKKLNRAYEIFFTNNFSRS